MAVQAVETKVKVRIKFDKDSQTLNQVKPTADDESLFNVAESIGKLKEYEEMGITKIVESQLVDK